MANFFAVCQRQQESSLDIPAEPKFESTKILAAPESAIVIKVEATTVAEVQQAIQHFYPGDVTGTTVVVTEAQFKES